MPPFTTFMVRQRYRCKLAILRLCGIAFTDDTLPSLYNLHWLRPARRLLGFSFALSLIYFHKEHITRIPSYSYCWSIVKLLLVSWVCGTQDPSRVPWASRGPGPRGPIDFTLGFLTSNPLGGFLQTFICNLIFRARFLVLEYSMGSPITFPQEQDKVPYCSCPLKKICLFLLCGIL